jgi:hypothetical protein
MKNRSAEIASTVPLLVMAVVVCSLLAACSLKRSERYTLVSDRPWPVGEARTCSLDNKWKEGHCFPPANLGTTKYKYLVDATLDESIRFDKDGWAGLDGSIICRLDSTEKATCIVEGPRGSE